MNTLYVTYFLVLFVIRFCVSFNDAVLFFLLSFNLINILTSTLYIYDFNLCYNLFKIIKEEVYR